jgi:hypothetical protein
MRFEFDLGVGPYGLPNIAGAMRGEAGKAYYCNMNERPDARAATELSAGVVGRLPIGSFRKSNQNQDGLPIERNSVLSMMLLSSFSILAFGFLLRTLNY